jgi:hypothetical protein
MLLETLVQTHNLHPSFLLGVVVVVDLTSVELPAVPAVAVDRTTILVKRNQAALETLHLEAHHKAIMVEAEFVEVVLITTLVEVGVLAVLARMPQQVQMPQAMAE